MIHPARTMPFDDLLHGLRVEIANGNINCQRDGDLALFCYSKACGFDRAWNPITELARGLILDVAAREVVATPFPKFFNVGERGGNDNWPALSFETFEKVDGSLIVIFWHGGRWRCATKGSFKSEQALKAQEIVDRNIQRPLQIGETYLAEYVGPDNRIVVRYLDSELVLLGAYRADGSEFGYQDVLALSMALGWRPATRHRFESFAHIMEESKFWPASMEGFVVRFSNGLRLKVKGDEYKRIHALVSNITPLGIWRAMEAGDDLVALKKQLPEEFWGDFDAICNRLRPNMHWLHVKADIEARKHAGKSDKEVGLLLPTIAADVRPFIFPMRNGTMNSPKTRRALFRAIRPTGNVLPGYTPSYAINRVMEEAA